MTRKTLASSAGFLFLFFVEAAGHRCAWGQINSPVQVPANIISPLMVAPVILQGGFSNPGLSLSPGSFSLKSQLSLPETVVPVLGVSSANHPARAAAASADEAAPLPVPAITAPAVDQAPAKAVPVEAADPTASKLAGQAAPAPLAEPASPNAEKTDLGTAQRLAADVAVQSPETPAALENAFDGNSARPEAVEPPPAAPDIIPESAKLLSRALPKLVIVDLRHMGDYVPPEALRAMARLMRAGVRFALMSDRPQTGRGSVEMMLRRGPALGGPDSIYRRRLMSLSHDGNQLYQYSAGSRRLIAPQEFSRGQLDGFAAAVQAAGIGHVLSSAKRGFTVKPKRGYTAQQLGDALLASLDKAGIPRDSYALSFFEDGVDFRVQLRPTTLSRAIPDLIRSLKIRGFRLAAGEVLLISKSKTMLDSVPGAIEPSLEAPDAAGEALLRACLAAMLAGQAPPRAGR